VRIFLPDDSLPARRRGSPNSYDCAGDGVFLDVGLIRSPDAASSAARMGMSVAGKAGVGCGAAGATKLLNARK
jgi:hypothetical protein